MDLVEKQPHMLVLFGLTLQHATWDRSRACLSPQDPGDWVDENSYCAIISYRVQDESQTSTPAERRRAESLPVYDCPVLLASKNVRDGGPCTGAQSQSPCLLFQVPLPFSPKLSDGVCLLCDSELHDAYM